MQERTSVRLEDYIMTGWTLFFTLIGVGTLAAQVLRVVDYIERPAHPYHQAAAH